MVVPSRSAYTEAEHWCVCVWDALTLEQLRTISLPSRQHANFHPNVIVQNSVAVCVMGVLTLLGAVRVSPVSRRQAAYFTWDALVLAVFSFRFNDKLSGAICYR